MNKQKQIRIFDKQAERYANLREKESQRRWRRQLLESASGRVLELAVGAGANFPYYPKHVQITAVDFSALMLEKAKNAAVRNHVDAAFIRADIEELDFPDGTFDTIVSTLSLCSYDEPQMVLGRLKRWCKPDGAMLFMEHGISSKRLVSAIQRTLDPVLYRMIGCHHNRNMAELIEQAGISILSVERHWLDMFYIIRAKP
ncbi:class I SAM-dependent methyltransferase [Paenibacillus nanensis]|uniref:Class I SAM-dependent methyltransferase n=1 Tax=Paenibacillus nanensis TaxID=393251 RepID=A0A3A1UZF2_9BACL|nr:class I SAM-dependent methyltransferase [Paenibacillus nanensis]RIX53969.1 class I SAM-dependent methyltransferase [Paenibacillus nanensis]